MKKVILSVIPNRAGVNKGPRTVFLLGGITGGLIANARPNYPIYYQPYPYPYYNYRPYPYYGYRPY